MTDDQMTGAELFAEAGEVLFGVTWPSQLAERLGVNVRTLQRVAKAARDGEDYPIPKGVWQDMAVVAQERATEAVDLVKRLVAYGARL
jgi:hypothetical protein